MKPPWIALAFMLAVGLSAMPVSAQVDAEEEERGLEERNELPGESVEEEWLGEEDEKIQTEVPAGDRKGGRCAIDVSSSNPSQVPIALLVLTVGLVVVRRLGTAPPPKD